MSTRVIKKIRKRVKFELTKLLKKIKYFLLKEWKFNLSYGDYPVNTPFLNAFLLNEFNRFDEKYTSNEINSANQIIEGHLNLIYFNNNKIKRDNPSYWHVDHESNYKYPIKYYGDLKYIINDDGTDVKNVWELSRLQHLVIVSKSYLMTQNDKYYFFVKENIMSWLGANPNGSSVNWTCNMEVAIRVVNLIVCYDLLSQRLSDDLEFKRTLKAMIYYHNRHIENNLENYSEKRNNHYLSNLMGLLISSKFLKSMNLKKYSKIQEFARLELQNEMDKQIYNDGFTYEATTSYQKLVYEILLISFLLGQSDSNKFEVKYVDKLYKMYTSLFSVVNAKGELPLVGDNDSGNIIVLNDYFSQNRSNLPSLMYLSEYYFSSSDVVNDCMSLYLACKSPKIYDTPTFEISYPDSGYYILKNEYFKVLVRCGPLSMNGQGGHSHNDQLSFVLDVEGLPVFIDPGTITYTGNSDLRNYSRKTSSHNTVLVNDEEQNPIGEDLFSLEERTFSKCTRHTINHFDGEHYGYVEEFGCTHKRSISIDGNQLSIVDRLDVIDFHKHVLGKVNLILSNNVEIINDDGLLMININNGKIMKTNLKIIDCSISDVLISDRYGYYKNSKKITCEFEKFKEIRLSV